MRHRVAATLVSWPLALSLCALLLNDFALKSWSPGVLTGKLSDFSGIAMVALLVFAAAGRHAVAAGIGLALAFLWWKSPASDGFIAAMNSIAPFRIGRVVDYSDLAALAVLPLCAHVARSPQAYALWSRKVRRFLALPTLLATCFATLATSVIPARQEYTIGEKSAGTVLDRRAVADAIRDIAVQRGMNCEVCATPLDSATFASGNVRMTYTFQGDSAVAFAVNAWPGFPIFSTSGDTRADELREVLKSELGHRFPNLQYVENLPPSVRHPLAQ